jgi:hypothetical protein
MDNNMFEGNIQFIKDKERIAAKLYFHCHDENGVSLREAPTNVESVNCKIAEIYSTSIENKFLSARHYGVANIEDVEEFDTAHTYYYYKDEYPNDLQFLFSDDSGKFVFSDSGYQSIKGYLINLTYGKKSVSLYKYRHNFDIHVKPTLLTLLRVDNELRSPSSESIIINEKFDYLIFDSYLFAMSISTLERKIKFDERVKRQSKEVIESLETHELQLVEDYAKLGEFLDADFNFAKKLKFIDFDGKLWNTPFSQVKKKIESRPKLSKYLKFSADGSKFSITSKQGAKIFFKLCNDKVMESILSGEVHLVDNIESVEETGTEPIDNNVNE